MCALVTHSTDFNQFENHFVIKDKICSEPDRERHIIVSYRNWNLSLDRRASSLKFLGKDSLVDALQETWTEPRMYPYRTIDDNISDFIFCHSIFSVSPCENTTLSWGKSFRTGFYR